MSVTGGIFNETILLQQQHMADELSLADRINQQFVPQIKVLEYLNSLQSKGLNMAFNTRPKKEYDVEIHWINTCEDFTIEDESCVRGGPEPSTNAQTYKLEKRISKGFTIYDADYRDNIYNSEQTIAKTLLQIDKQIVEEFAQYAVNFLNGNSGVNQVAVGKGVIDPVDPTITNIAPADWTAELMAYFSRVKIINKFGNAALVSGNNMYESLFVANAMKENSNGKGDFVLWGGMPTWFDLFNVDTVNNPDLFTYMVNQGSFAIVSKSWNPTMGKYMDHYAYTMRSRFFPGFEYDVYYDNKCNNDARFNDTVVHNWKIVLTADIFSNPFGCDAVEGEGGIVSGLNSGILRFKNTVIPPAP